jgi:amidase
VAASLGAVAIGTETDGSLVCPGSINGVVSFKPTVGLVSRTHVVPISHSQDTPGPMGRSVADVAALLNGMAGSDAADPATKEADAKKTDYLKAIKSASLRGLRVGVFHKDSDPPDDEDALFAKTVAALKKAGAVVVPVTMPEIPFDKAGALELMVLLTELKADMNAYLATTPAAVKTRSLADVIAFNDATPRETALFGQELFHAAELAKGLDDADYKMAHGDLLRMAKDEGLDAIFARDKLDVLVMATDGPSWRIDLIKGDNSSGSASFLPAVAGYPHLTVPMGYVRGLPVGLSFIGEAWDDAKVLRAGAAFEKATKARVAPAYVPSLESAPDAAAAFAPVNR